ncbi:MAG: crossover junction endodeoxyribonuclease RuvC [Oscillospiraceae bacterium]|nr:crossover junction endodeoxyribonuclease RuvC [Oscillospiraceae bacterium]
MTILGIDPGYATVGFGIVQGNRSRHRLVQCGVITTSAGAPFAERLKQVFDDVSLLIRQFEPDAIAVEELFFNKNEKTAIQVAHARGVLLLAGAASGVPLFEYTPLQVKMAVSGYGRAGKQQVQEMVRRLLQLSQIPKPDDAADALAIALCHLRSATNLLGKQDGGTQACSTI